MDGPRRNSDNNNNGRTTTPFVQTGNGDFYLIPAPYMQSNPIAIPAERTSAKKMKFVSRVQPVQELKTGNKVKTQSKKKKNSGQFQGKGAKWEKELDDDTLTKYKGPVRLPSSSEGIEIQTLNMAYSSTISASGAGALVLTLASDTLLQSVSDWASMVATFTEYRILAMEFNYAPIIKYYDNTGGGSPNQIYPPVISVVQHSDSAALTGYAQAAVHESAKIHRSDRNIVRTIRMADVSEAVWVDINQSPNNLMYIKMYGSGFTNSANIAQGIYTFLVQFRGRK